jgi:O-antigen ligase
MNEMIVNNQVGLLGLGLNNVNYLIEQYFNYYNLYKGYFHLNFHNQYFQTIGELGFIGLLLLLVIYFISFYYALIKNNIFQIVIIILFFAAFFTESFLSRQKGVFLFVTIFSIMHKVTEHKKIK